MRIAAAQAHPAWGNKMETTERVILHGHPLGSAAQP